MRRRAFALAVTAALLLSGCALPASRSGGSEAAGAVKLGTPDIAGRPSAVIIAAFQDEVESQTGGSIRVEPEWQVVGADPSDDEIAREVASGAVEFGVVPARGWDLLGVESLMPLQLPGLIVTDAAAAAVATDPVADELMAGLDEAGVTGLALVPDGIRRLFVVPPETPGTFTPEGAGIRSMNSKASEELFELVGATTTEASGIDLDAQILSGDVTAVETSWNLLDNLSIAVSAVGDVPLFTKFEVIAVNSEWFAARSESEREAIRSAAQAAAQRVIAGTTPDAEQAEAFCSAGGTIEPASADTVGAFVAARKTLELRRRAESSASELVDRLVRVVASTPDAAPIPFCTPAGFAPVPANTAPAQTPFPDGIYRMDVSLDELMDAGMHRGDAVNHAGIWTLTFDDGALLMGDMGGDCPGNYVVHGDQVELHLDREAGCGGAAGRMLFSARWELDGSTLQFLDMTSGESGPGADAFIQMLFQRRPFAKIA